MKQQITTAIDVEEMAALDKTRGDRTRYEFAQQAICEKIEREQMARMPS